MKTYVVGFMFSKSKEHVVLIRKNKPAWQNGFLNGVGGSIEQNETPLDAMVREFEEETGVKTTATNWSLFCEATFDKQVKLYLFRCFDHNDSFVNNIQTMESEPVDIYMVDMLNDSLPPYRRTVPNLKTFIPMALNEEFLHVKIKCRLNA